MCQLHWVAHRKRDNKFNRKTFSSLVPFSFFGKNFPRIHIVMFLLSKSKWKFCTVDYECCLFLSLDIFCHFILKNFHIPLLFWSGFIAILVWTFDVLGRNAIMPLHSNNNTNIIWWGFRYDFRYHEMVRNFIVDINVDDTFISTYTSTHVYCMAFPCCCYSFVNGLAKD